jgi:hypothetical protein
MPLITCEMRWFFDGPLPDEATRWFEGGAAAPWRDDRYLVLPGVADMGIKRREGRLEIKGRTVVLGNHRIAPAIEGVAERWCKWSYDPAIESFLGRATIVVGKCRVQRYFLLSSDGSAQETAQRDLARRGFSVELTRIRLAGADHWSLGVEAAPDDGTLLDDLLRALADVLRGFPLPLPPMRSRSYPGWLMDLGDTARRRA